ncbi:MAG: DUF2480 family protein [Saprospiraceae bacterium]
MEEKALVNRVANSGLVTIKLEGFFPRQEQMTFDMKDYLFMGLVLKEKDFREALAVHDWAAYQGKILLVHCSMDAIIPLWAYMLVATHAAPYAIDVFQGTAADYIKYHYLKTIHEMDMTPYEGQRIVIKGCSDEPVPAAAYLALSRRLQPVAKSIMFGEPCSTVPVYKKRT